MKTRFARLWLLLFGIAVATVLFSVLLSREPEYQGKRMSAWFKQYCRTSQRFNQSNAEQHAEAAQALRAIGTNAVPFLLEEFYDYSPDSPLRTNVLTLCQIDVQQIEALEVLLQYARDQTNSQRGFAIMSLGNVGPNAQAAIPVLVEAAREEDGRVWNIAATALVKIGETNLALSRVAQRLKREEKQIRLNAAMFIVC